MHETSDELDDLVERAAADDGERLPYWDPEPGEVLAGTLLYYTEGVTSIGERRIAVIERHPDRERISVWLSRSVLRGEFERVAPEPGDGVVIKYFGEKEPRNSNARSYHLYRLWKTSKQAVSSPSTPAPAAPTTARPASPPPEERSDDDLPF